MIDLEEVTFAYPHQAPIFTDFSWRIGSGEVWSILGPSGCGKSTLLLLLAGLQHPQAGAITVHGAPLTRPRPNTALVLQEYGLLPWATLRDNVTLGLRIRRLYGPDGRHAPRTDRLKATTIDRIGEQWLQRLDIADVAVQKPAQVSGGQRQRAAIARALVLEPDLLLMDEPFAALDAPTRESLQTLTLDLAAEENLTVLLVTHSIEEAAFIGQNVLLLNDQPNRRPHTIANPHPAGAYRRSTAYHTACSRLRRKLDEIQTTSALAEGAS